MWCSWCGSCNAVYGQQPVAEGDRCQQGVHRQMPVVPAFRGCTCVPCCVYTCRAAIPGGSGHRKPSVIAGDTAAPDRLAQQGPSKHMFRACGSQNCSTNALEFPNNDNCSQLLGAFGRAGSTTKFGCQVLLKHAVLGKHSPKGETRYLDLQHFPSERL